jgi:hypothetical protein
MMRLSLDPVSPAWPAWRLDDPDDDLDDFDEDDFEEGEDEEDEELDEEPWGDEDEGGPEWQVTVGLSSLDGLTYDQEPPRISATSD